MNKGLKTTLRDTLVQASRDAQVEVANRIVGEWISRYQQHPRILLDVSYPNTSTPVHVDVLCFDMLPEHHIQLVGWVLVPKNNELVVNKKRKCRRSYARSSQVIVSFLLTTIEHLSEDATLPLEALLSPLTQGKGLTIERAKRKD